MGVTAAVVSEQEAQELIERGKAPAVLHVAGHLNLAARQNDWWRGKEPSATKTLRLPATELVVESLTLSGREAVTTLPRRLHVRGQLDISGSGIRELPHELDCGELVARRTPIERLPKSTRVRYRLDLSECDRLSYLPDNLSVGTLTLRRCGWLEALPEGLSVNFLDISGCTALRHLPERGTFAHGNFLAAGCWRLSSLPPWVRHVARLSVQGWIGLTELPADLTVASTLDIGDTALTRIPEGAKRAQLLWRGVPVDERIAFRPESITAHEVLAETNVERRRVLIERMGYECFLQEARAKVLDSDLDAGGRRQLLRVELERDEPLVCLAVTCPSTARRYVLRVPPTMERCRQAAAWIAGFDDPSAYRPLIET